MKPEAFAPIQAAFDRQDYANVFPAVLEFAEHGHLTAQEIAGNCYQLGLGTAVDYPKAAYWYDRAIALGSGLAANNLAGMVQRGWEGNPSDEERAKELFRQARALGFEHAPIV